MCVRSVKVQILNDSLAVWQDHGLLLYPVDTVDEIRKLHQQECCTWQSAELQSVRMAEDLSIF